MIWTIPAAKILRTTAMRTTARTAAGILRTTAKTAARTVERTKPRTADRITRTGRFPIREAALFSFHGEECIELKRKSAAFPMKQKTFRCGSEHFSHRGARTGDPPLYESIWSPGRYQQNGQVRISCIREGHIPVSRIKKGNENVGASEYFV